MKSVGDKTYWDSHWQKTKLEIAPKNHPVRQWIERNLPSREGLSCLEVGCYPGKFLAVFGEKGYELYGLDIFAGTNSLLPDWLKSQGYKVGAFRQSDFLTLKTQDSYDIVSSFGFIEHFPNWQKVLRKHIELTKENGTIVVEVPNLKSPLYYFLYSLLEPRVLKNHVLSAMDLDAIRTTLEKNGCTIQSANYIGNFYFRFVTKHTQLTEVVASIINFFKPIFQLLPPSLYTRYIGVIAIRRQNKK